MSTQDGATVMAKSFEGHQTLTEMIGYCLKDTGQPHFQFETLNISPEELHEGRLAYGQVRNAFADRKELTKRNLLQLTANF